MTSISFLLDISCSILSCKKAPKTNLTKALFILKEIKQILYSSVGKESTCSAGDPGSIPGLGRSTGEGKGYPPQSSWASLMAQLVKNLPAVWETWVRSLGWEDPLEKGKATHPSILAWRIPKSQTRLSDFYFLAQKTRCFLVPLELNQKEMVFTFF